MDKKKKILVPIDFSDCSKQALIKAADLARNTNNRITLLHAYGVPNELINGDVLGVPQPLVQGQYKISHDIREDLKRKTRQFVSSARLTDWKWDGHIILKEGSPKSVILQKIKAQNFGLVIMGTNGSRAEKGIWEDSLTYEVAKDSACPVIVVPCLNNKKSINNIIYTTDLQHYEHTALAKVAEVASIYDASIKLVHVMRENEDEVIKRQELKKMLADLPYPKHKKNFELLTGENAIIRLSQYVDNHQVDMISMTTHTHNILQRIFNTSFTRFLILYSEFPLLVFNEENSGPLQHQPVLTESLSQ